jgi:hypothetical protein
MSMLKTPEIKNFRGHCETVFSRKGAKNAKKRWAIEYGRESDIEDRRGC